MPRTPYKQGAEPLDRGTRVAIVFFTKHAAFRKVLIDWNNPK